MSDLGASTWSEVDASNTTAVPNGWPEGMQPSGVNNSARAEMGATKRFWNRINPIKTSAGSSTAYTLTYDQAASSYYDGELVSWVVDETCGNAPTLNINGLGARALRKWSGSWVALTAGDLVTDQVAIARYNLAATSFDVILGQNASPPGAVVDYAGTVAPGGWLLCYGQAVSRTTYAGLFAVIGTTYGGGDGSTTFNLPDLRGRVAAGKSNMGGSDAGNLSGGGVLGAGLGSQTNTAVTNVSGSTSGALSVTATGNVLDPPSTITTSSPGVGQNHAGSDHLHANVQVSGSASGSLTVSASGTSGAFSVVQPTQILNKIIKT